MNIEIFWPKANHKAIIPVFLPFMGCKVRCIFCAQDRQTGEARILNLDELKGRLFITKKCLLNFKLKHGYNAELAFYGGTFTALPEAAWRECLKFIEECHSLELISTFRCSTRPDALELSRINELKILGCKTIELGIQTFNDLALSLSRRAYDGKEALSACKILKKYGFVLGVQLLPGMPGVSPEIFINDVLEVCLLEADLLRFYPCLVLAGTGLEGLWKEGKFQVWTMEESIEFLSRAWNLARKSNIIVSRIGLAPDKSLLKNILAGPYHPCLGSRIQAQALYQAIIEIFEKNLIYKKIKEIYLPKYVQGFFWGWNGELKTCWQEMGLTKEHISYWDRSFIKLKV